MRRLFVTGTDTGAGKTFVTAAMARRARTLNKKVFGFKPIETGCEVDGDRRIGADMEVVNKSAGDWQTGDQRGVYQFLQPLAPFVAAQAESTTIDLDRIARVANSAPEVDVLLVEGAGGWRVPITETEDMSSLAKRLKADVVIVGRAGLGTINHSLLTIEAVERDGLKVAALILSRRPTDDIDFAASNQEQIRRQWAGPVMIFDNGYSIFDPLL
jgi:dethiobiotin synthetase